MKQRIFLITLTLCLCVSFQSVAFAYEETSLTGMNSLTEESPALPDPNDDEDNTLREDSPQEAGDFTEAPAALPDPGDDGNTVRPEDLSQEEDILTEEPADQPDPDDGEDTVPEEEILQEEDVLTEESADGLDSDDNEMEALPEERSPEKGVLRTIDADRPAMRDGVVPTPAEAYEAMIALKDEGGYGEGAVWTDDKPYSAANGFYHWKGGTLGGDNIVAVGCVAFAFTLSDRAFGSLPARMYDEGGFAFEDIKVGDILRVHNDTHTVIVLEVIDSGVIVAEGNYGGKVHWGRAISKDDVMGNTSHYITRYPEGYVSPDDSEAGSLIAEGTLDGGLSWKLTKEGTLTVSGEGAMPDFNSAAEQPWSDNGSVIRKVVVGEGVTSIGSCAFRGCGVLSAEIPSSVESIGSSAFRGSSIISVTIPSGVKTVGDSAFCECQDLGSVTVGEGVETISPNAFGSCMSLASIALPASIREVGDAAFFGCTSMKYASFAPGDRQVKLGKQVFLRCWNLMSVTLPRNIDHIGEEMFLDCIMLPGVEIPQGVETIEMRAFSSCSNMTVVIIPDSVTTIGAAAFADCPLADIYFTGAEAQWNGIRKIADTALALSKPAIHYNYIPGVDPGPVPDDGDDDNTGGSTGDNTGGDAGDNTGGSTGDNTGDAGDNNTGGSTGNNTGGSTGDNTGGGAGDNTGGNSGDNTGSSTGNPVSSSGDGGSGHAASDSVGNESVGIEASVVTSGEEAAVETWKPVTPEEIGRYDCMGKETVQYVQSSDNASPVRIENAMQGPLCFQAFEAALGDYTIGRTYNIYMPSDPVYSVDGEVQFTIKIPPAIYNEDREYKMICVTKGGRPIIYNDLDSDSETITIKTKEFYAYALIYRQKQAGKIGAR
ncbi:MAG: leucine-rich repeat protein [Blautia sp.]|nr:leucine-rich repeat protein [Blautia sp.]MCM1200974.1 leucine-rich repeat protein [Bacteroides fragilis]